MAKQVIDTTTNNGSYIGDPASTAFGKVNANFDELYSGKFPGNVTVPANNSTFGGAPGNTASNINIGLGSASINSYVDFYSAGSASNTSPSARILSSGGTSGTSSSAALNYQAASHTFNNKVTVSAGDMNVSAGAVRTSTGYRCRAGAGGTEGANTFNIYWSNSAAALYIDTVLIGNISTSSSDSRIKQDVTYPSAADDLTALLALKPAEFRYKEGTLYDDGERHRSFIAQEVAAVSSMLSEGDADAVDEKNNVLPMGIDIKALISVCVGAIQAQSEQITALKERISALESSETT